VGGEHVCAVVTPAMKPLCGRFNSSSQAAAPLDLSNVTSICTGDRHSCAVSSGRVACWGDNDFNQSAAPAEITDAVLVRCGAASTCVMTSSRNVSCFGVVSVDPSGVVPPEPLQVPLEATSNVGQLSTGLHHVCVTLLDEGSFGHSGRVLCFGNAGAFAGLPANATVDVVAAFQNTTCIGNVTGPLMCVGDTSSIGAVPDVIAGVADAVGGNGFAVAKSAGGLLSAWGPSASNLSPAAGMNATAVAAGNDTLCIRALDGGVLCFGAGQDYLLETFSIGGGFSSAAAAAEACGQYGAQLATLQQLQRDFHYGAEWCNWGFVADADPDGNPILAYPMQQGNVPGCSNDGPRIYTSAATNTTLAAAICWGRRPADVTQEMLPFNLDTWSLLGGKRKWDGSILLNHKFERHPVWPRR